MTLERLAADFGYTVTRLRASLAAHLEAFSAALGIELPAAPMPEAVPEAPPITPPVRIRERVSRSDLNPALVADHNHKAFQAHTWAAPEVAEVPQGPARESCHAYHPSSSPFPHRTSDRDELGV